MVKAAYKAVMKPTEGTILTVARVAHEEGAKALTAESTETGMLMQTMIDGARRLWLRPRNCCRY